MPAVALPALDGREPLAFLAALGVLRLAHRELGTMVRLCFSDRDATAMLDSDLASTQEIASMLRGIIDRIPPDAVVPDGPAAFPLRAGTGTDPMRVPREELRDLYGRFPGDTATAWLPGLLTDLAADGQQRVAQTPFTAPSGKQNLRGLFDKPLEPLRKRPQLIHDALVGWRRVPGVTGEYLDHRVLNSTADDPLGRKGMETGVPGATWLAVMSLPLLPITGDGTRIRAPLWHHVPGRRTPLMAWPLWRRPLDVHATRTLIQHPTIRPQSSKGGPTISRHALAALGAFILCGAERQRVPGRNFAGVLAPTPIVLTD